MSFLNRFFSGASSHDLVSAAEYKSRYFDNAQPHTLVDVRTAQEFSQGRIPGAVNISLQELRQKLDRIPADKPVVVYCRSGNRSAFAARTLLQAGYEEVYDLGGIMDWARQGLPLES